MFRSELHVDMSICYTIPLKVIMYFFFCSSTQTNHETEIYLIFPIVNKKYLIKHILKHISELIEGNIDM